MDPYDYFSGLIKEVEAGTRDAETLSKDIEQAYQDGMLMGTSYDSLMSMLNEWR